VDRVLTQEIIKTNISMATVTLEKSLLNEMSRIMGNKDLMEQTI